MTNKALLTQDQLHKALPHCKVSHVAEFYPHVVAALEEFKIDTPHRIAFFLGQVAHESAEFRYVKELASGHEYEGRHDLGNTHPGDGVRYKGRGLVQITGRANYLTCGKALGLDLINHPELLEQPREAVRSACWFWNLRKLSDHADKFTRVEYQAVTKRINGGLNGWTSRVQYLRLSCAALGIKSPA